MSSEGLSCHAMTRPRWRGRHGPRLRCGRARGIWFPTGPLRCQLGRVRWRPWTTTSRSPVSSYTLIRNRRAPPPTPFIPKGDMVTFNPIASLHRCTSEGSRSGRTWGDHLACRLRPLGTHRSFLNGPTRQPVGWAVRSRSRPRPARSTAAWRAPHRRGGRTTPCGWRAGRRPARG